MIGALCRFDGQGLKHESRGLQVEAIRRHIESRLARLPRFRQRLMRVPLALGTPLWADDSSFDISEHVRFASIPPPGDDAQLRAFIGKLLEAPLDPDRPLWQLWILDGAADGSVIVIPKVSHVMADGIALLDFAASVLDADPSTEPETPEPWTPEPPPGRAALAARAWIDRSRRQLEAARAVAAAFSHPAALVSGARLTAETVGGLLRAAPASELTAQVGPRRDFSWFEVTLGELRLVGHELSVTLNDLVLAASAGALRGHSLRTGGELADHDARVLVPVSMHDDPEGELTDNRFSVLVACLPTSTPHPLDRVRQVHSEMTERKESGQAGLTAAIYRIADFLPLDLLARLAPPALARQPFVNLAVTNLPGSPVPLHFLGSRLEQLYPIVTVTGNVALIVGVVSYGDGLGVGITADPEVVTDLDGLTKDFQSAFGEVIGLARPA